MHLEFGKNLDTKNIKEGDDAYFECHVKARPEITKIQWMHNVSKPLVKVLSLVRLPATRALTLSAPHLVVLHNLRYISFYYFKLMLSKLLYLSR